MSRSGLLLLLLLAPVGALAAQTAADRLQRQDQAIAELTRRRDSLGQLYEAAQALVQLQDSLAHAASVGRLDTIAVGALRIITNGDQGEWRTAAEQYWPTVDSLYGDAAGALAQRPALIQMIAPDSATRWSRVQPWGLTVPTDRTARERFNILRATISMASPDSALRDWLPGGVQVPFVSLTEMAGDAYVALVTAASSVAHRCYLGEVEACRLALMLDLGPETMVRAFPAPEERRAAVVRLENMFTYQSRLKPAYYACVAGSDTTCVDLLRSLPPRAALSTLDPAARQFLVQLALRMGGRGAYHRLIQDSTASIAARLAAAAAVPVDTLVAHWRGAVIAGRPAPVSLPVTEAAISLGWVVLLGLCCLRSSRWRLD